MTLKRKRVMKTSSAVEADVKRSKPPFRHVGTPELCYRTGFSSVTIWKKQRDGKFPKRPVKDTELEDYLNDPAAWCKANRPTA